MAVALDGSTRTKEAADSRSVSELCCPVPEQLREARPAPTGTDTAPRAASYRPCAAARPRSPMRRSAVRDLGGGGICTATTQGQPRKLSDTFLKLLWQSKGGSLGRRNCWCQWSSLHILSFLTQLFPHPFCTRLGS